jgi:hypothetical protein
MSPTNSVAVNVSEIELSKTDASQKVLAFAHTERGQLKGSKKDPSIGRAAFNSVRGQLLDLIQGDMVISSTGGGTGNGITSQILEVISNFDTVPDIRKTQFSVILPYAPRESHEFISNTLDFLKGPLSKAMIVEALKQFESIPRKGDMYELLEGHIDQEDFSAYRARAFFNYFSSFDYDPDRYFDEQLEEFANPLLLRPDNPIEAMFLLEVPQDTDHTMFYNILDHFASIKVAPMYSVVRNPSLERPRITVSLLYSSKPTQLVDDFNRISEESTRVKIDKSLQQLVQFEPMQVNMQQKAEEVAHEKGQQADEILSVLKRLGKLK